MADVEVVKANISKTREQIATLRSQLQILNQLKPLRQALKNLGVRAKNTEDKKVLRRLTAQRAEVRSRIAKLKINLTTTMTQEAARKRALALIEKLRSLNAQLTESAKTKTNS